MFFWLIGHTAELLIVRLGTANPTGSGYYAQVAGRPTVYLLAKDDAQRLLDTTAFSLRDKKLLAFEPGAVHALRVQCPTSAFMLTRQQDTWTVSEPRSETIPQGGKVDHLLDELQALEYATMLTDADESDGRYGPETPQMRITPWQKDGTVVGALTIGASLETVNPGERLAYAPVNTKSALYVVPTTLLDHLPKTPEELPADR